MELGEIVLQKDDRNHFIDVLKGICIVFVVITHYAWKAEERLRYLFPFWIDMAVPVFMIISRFVYAKSYQKNGIISIADAYRTANIVNKIIRYTIPFAFAFIVEEVIFVIIGHPIKLIPLLLGFLSGGTGPGSYYYPIMIQFIFV